MQRRTAIAAWYPATSHACSGATPCRRSISARRSRPSSWRTRQLAASTAYRMMLITAIIATRTAAVTLKALISSSFGARAATKLHLLPPEGLLHVKRERGHPRLLQKADLPEQRPAFFGHRRAALRVQASQLRLRARGERAPARLLVVEGHGDALVKALFDAQIQARWNRTI